MSHLFDGTYRTWEQFWPDVFVDATSDSYKPQQELKQVSRVQIHYCNHWVTAAAVD